MKLNFNNNDSNYNFQNQQNGSFDVSVVLPNELMDFIKSIEKSQNAEVNEEKYCPNCGKSLTEIREELMVGCEVCYQFFKNEISDEMKKRNLFPRLYEKNLMRDLVKQLKIAITTENYEEAMKIKKKIDEVNYDNSRL